MFPCRSDKTLPEVLQGKRILWHPACFESMDKLGELQVGMRDCDREIGLVPDVFLLTDDRLESIPTFGTIVELQGNSIFRKVTVNTAYEHARLCNLQGVLGFEDINDRNSGNRGRVVECQCKCETFENSIRDATIVFVVAESVEFLYSVLLPNRIAVDIIYQNSYHRGFNCCLTNGGWLRRATSVLQTKWYYTDDIGARDYIEPDYDEEYKAYPSLLAFRRPDVESMDSDFGCGNVQCYRVVRS